MTVQKDSDLEFMLQTPRWPWWPLLALKRHIDLPNGRHVLQAGVLWSLDFDGQQFCWFEGVNLFDTERLKTLRTSDGTTLRRDELQTLLDDGWRVD